MIQATPIISRGMKALRLPAFFENLGHSRGTLTAGEGSAAALDQSCRYADLELDVAEPIKNGKHSLVAYIIKPKADDDYLATAAHFAAESSTGTDVNVLTTADFTKSVDTRVCYIDPEVEEMRIAYPIVTWPQHHRWPRNGVLNRDIDPWTQPRQG